MIEEKEKKLYTFGVNLCGCPSKTCSCPKLAIYENGKLYLAINELSTAEHLTDALNFYEKYKINKEDQKKICELEELLNKGGLLE